jgi:pimeloyl-ACP methyl ester carboxylesterase
MPIINSIYFTDHRKSDAPDVPVILVHGAGGSHLDWSIAIRRASQALAIDLPAHGKSAPPSHATISGYAQAVIDWMDGLNIPQAVIGGHSMGGAIAQTIALEYPERVAGLILIGTGAKLRVHPDILNLIQVNQAGVADMLKDWLWSADAPDQLRNLTYQQVMALSANVLHDDYLACDNFDVRDQIKNIHAPTLVIGGTQDTMTPHKFSVYLAENIPNADLVTVEEAGHMLILEQPEIVANAMSDWLIRMGLV